MYYGVTQIQGGNWGFLDLGLPSRWANAAGTPRDGGGQGSSTPAATNAAGSRQPQIQPSQGVPSTAQQLKSLQQLEQQTGIPAPVQQGIR
jgi:hypothetical protein